MRIFTFIELPAFERHRDSYLDDAEFRALQAFLAEAPDAGEVIRGSGGVRKLRWRDPRRRKGKRGGLRILYYFWASGGQFWLFTIYGKDEADDLSAAELRTIKQLLAAELRARSRGV